MDNQNRYFIARDADTIAKFISRKAKWELQYALYTAGNGEFPRPIGKNAKWPAYEAASRIERALGLEKHAGSVPELAETLSAAMSFLAA